MNDDRRGTWRRTAIPGGRRQRRKGGAAVGMVRPEHVLPHVEFRIEQSLRRGRGGHDLSGDAEENRGASLQREAFKRTVETGLAECVRQSSCPVGDRTKLAKAVHLIVGDRAFVGRSGE